MPEEAEAKPAKKKLPIKVIGIIAAIMLLEGVGVFLFVSMTGKAPQDAMADLEGSEEAKLLEPVEIELIKGNFQNMQTGKAWSWSIDVYLKVKKRDEATVRARLESQKAEIRERLNQLIRRSNQQQLKEPDLRTLNRQITAIVNEIFGTSDVDGLPRVERVLIPRCEGFRAN
jgi:flagellar basal body-associated protein FliL